MAEDRTQGALDQTKGIVKEKVGKISGDRSTEVSGKLDQAQGKIERTIGDAKATVRKKDGLSR